MEILCPSPHTDVSPFLLQSTKGFGWWQRVATGGELGAVDLVRAGDTVQNWYTVELGLWMASCVRNQVRSRCLDGRARVNTKGRDVALVGFITGWWIIGGVKCTRTMTPGTSSRDQVKRLGTTYQ